MNIIQLLNNKGNTRASLVFFLIYFSASTIFGQIGQIAGKVTDDKTGEVLIGAAVAIQGTGIGTITDIDGNFLLSDIHEGTYNLVVSYLAYDSKIIKADVTDGGINQIDLKLEPIAIGLGTVTVVGKQKTNTEL
jgi:hypothetical protein